MGAYYPMVQAGLAVAQQVAQAQGPRRQADAAAEAQAQQQSLQSQMLWQQQEQRARQQRDLLKRQMATARASLAAGGIGFGGGSGQALMAGMTKKAEEDIADGYDAASLRHQLQFGDGQDRPDNRATRSLGYAQDGLNILKPFFS